MHMFNANHKLIRFSIVTAVLFVALLTLLMGNVVPSIIQAEGDTVVVCETSVYMPNPHEGEIVFGVIPVELQSNRPDVEKVTFFIHEDILGVVSSSSEPAYLTRYHWDTSTFDNGDYILRSEVKYRDGFMCSTSPRHVIVENASTTSALLRVNITPQDEWTGPTNTTFSFKATSFLIDASNGSVIEEVTNETSFTWDTTIGVIGLDGDTGNFFSGPNPGPGKMTLTAHYGGQDQTRLVQLSIFDSGEPGSDYDDYFEEEPGDGSDDNSTPDSTGTPDDNDGTNENIVVPEDPNRVDSSLALCLMQRLGEEAYEELLEKDMRMTPEQLSDSYGCFSERRFVIPARIAPVDPAKVIDLPEEDRVLKIEKLNPVIGVDGKTAEGIEFSGYAEPNSSILIYIFSEPLVLSGQTDSDGRWTYTLKDPLEPGTHEAYVLVETDEGYVRSSSFGFEVAQAASTDNNPYGYSLAIVEDDRPPLMNYFVLGIITLILLSSVVLARFVWFRPHKDVPVAEVTPSPMNDRSIMPEVELEAEAVSPTIEPTATVPPVSRAKEEDEIIQPVETQSNSPAEPEDEIPR